MSDREPVGWRVNPDVKRRFLEFVEEKHGKTRSVAGKELENAMLEYMDATREARNEEKLDTVNEKLDEALTQLRDLHNTHTQTKKSKSNLERIASELNGNEGVVTETDLKKIIIDVADLDKGDPRTIRDYKQRLKEGQFAFEHPREGSPIWTADPEEWAGWTENFVEPQKISEVQSQYGLTTEEFELLLGDDNDSKTRADSEETANRAIGDGGAETE